MSSKIKRNRPTSTSSDFSDSDEKFETRRLPTRVPDPTIKNRNAILARENRKRKKQIMAQLELETDQLKTENRQLRKSLKFKDSKIVTLENEINYLKSILANKSEIISVLRSLPKDLPKNSSAFNWIKTEVKEEPEDRTFSCSSEVSTCDGKKVNDAYPQDLIQNSFSLIDYTLTEEWETFKSPLEDSLEEVIGEHNYFDKHNVTSTAAPGICVHVSNKKISLEFCASCHQNASNAWEEN
jgi:hypothetical protein